MNDGPFVHAWVVPHEIGQDRWTALRADATRILRAASARLERGRADDAPGILRGPDGLGLPQVSAEHVAFNGSSFRGEAGDPFLLQRISTSGVIVRAGAGTVGRAVRRCDTRGHPYDLAVCALLLIVRHHMGPDMRLGSSGNLHGAWRDAADVVRDAVGVPGQLVQNEKGLISWSAPAAPVQVTQVRNSA